MAFQPVFPVTCLHDVRQLEQSHPETTLGITSTYAIFSAAAQDYGDSTALTFLETAEPGGPSTHWSYRQLLRLINQTANCLYGSGIGAHDVVSILLPGCAEYQLALWGGEAAGIVNPLNPLLSAQILAELMNTARSSALITYAGDTDVDYWQRAQDVISRVPSLSKVFVVTPGDRPFTETRVGNTEVVDFKEAIAGQPDDRLLSNRQIQSPEIAAYFHTGGTTGSPKLARHTHGNQVFSAWASVNLQGTNKTDIIINGYPQFHVAGVLPGSLTALSAGAESIIPTSRLMRNRDVIRNYWKLVDHHQVTVVTGVPTVLDAISSTPLEGVDTSTIRYCRTGAAPLTRELSERFFERFELRIRESLGMTEMAGITSISPPGVETPVGCVGFPIPHCRVKIVSANRDNDSHYTELETGQVGELIIKSPNVFPGYLDEDQTRKSFTPDGWLISGDLGFIDDSGLLHIAGRAKDLIIRSGHNIDPGMIERALARHPAVDQCVAIGAPDGYAGEIPVAFVTLDSEQQVSRDELRNYATDRVDEAPARPRSVYVLDAMPLTNVGKIFKPELRRLATLYVIEEMLESLKQQLPDLILNEISVQLDPLGKVHAELTLGGQVESIDATRSQLKKLPVELAIFHDT